MNRTIDDTDILRQDGRMILTEQMHTRHAIGFCEVKASDNEGDVPLHEDLFRLSRFCKDALDVGNIKAMVAVQAVGTNTTFYFFSLEAPGLYVMFEVGRIAGPSSYKQLSRFVMDADFLRQVSSTYRLHCIKRTSDDKIVGRKRRNVEKDILDEF